MEESLFLKNLIKKYDKELKTKRNKDFLSNFNNVEIPICMPLSEEETYIYRCITGVFPGFTKKSLAKSINIKEETLNKKLRVIRSVLTLYFYDVQACKQRYNKTINSTNENITIFDLGLSNEGLFNLRLLKCYYLKDITTAREETIKEI